MDVAIGTVQATCLPALRALIDCSAWSGIGVLMWTASISGSRELGAETETDDGDVDFFAHGNG